METMQKIGGKPSENGEYTVEGTKVRAIERNEFDNPEIKGILGNRHIAGFPTILIKKENGFDEYDGPRDGVSLTNLFTKDAKKQRSSSVMGGRRRKTRRKPVKRTGGRTGKNVRRTGKRIGRRTGKRRVSS
jgi:hypothetical protein